MGENMRIDARWIPAFVSVALFTSVGCGWGQESHRLESPDGKNVVLVEVEDGKLVYSIDRENRKLILPSGLGFEFRGAPPMGSGLVISEVSRNSVDEAWEQPWGEVRYVRDHHNELRVS
ncbi:MAG: glycoside hydrolase family 97 N-terminal domain-containing protein, partial [marine benthic group bacterium]|nr:glycoside hydrolase family 97 N-terminal domain-containing protein [Gemmatimonadota bacterium]